MLSPTASTQGPRGIGQESRRLPPVPWPWQWAQSMPVPLSRAINKASWACKPLTIPVSIPYLKPNTFFRFHLFSSVALAVRTYAFFKMLKSDCLSEMGLKSKPYFHKSAFWDLRENRIVIQGTLDIRKLKHEQQAKSVQNPHWFGLLPEPLHSLA